MCVLPQAHRGVARVLGRVDEEAHAATRALAGDLQWEYDDEYDDSFDDLGVGSGACVLCVSCHVARARVYAVGG